ncbi:hypothetical protein Tco_0640625 [Tanacetum coccineum]
MSDNMTKAQSLKTVLKAGQSSMARDGSLFVYNQDVVREQFTDHFNKRARNDRLTSPEYERCVTTDFIAHLRPDEFSSFDVLGFLGKGTNVSNSIPNGRDMLSVQATSDHLDSTDRIQHTSNLENSLDFEEEILDEDVLENEAIALFDEEIALDEVASEARSNISGAKEIDMTLSD